MPVQTRSTRVKAPAISYPNNVPVEALSTNGKATLNLSGRIGFERPLEGSSVNHENDYYKILKYQWDLTQRHFFKSLSSPKRS